MSIREREKQNRIEATQKTVHLHPGTRNEWGNVVDYRAVWVDGVYPTQNVKASTIRIWERIGFNVVHLFTSAPTEFAN